MHITDLYGWLPIGWAGMLVCVILFYFTHYIVYLTASALKRLHFHKDHEKLRRKYPWILGLATSMAHYPCLTIMYLSIAWIVITPLVTVLLGSIWIIVNYPIIAAIILVVLATIATPLSIYTIAWKRAEKRRRNKKP